VLASRFEKLSIAFRHAEAAATLPRHHSDPFDRMLIAQCLCERLVLVTRNRKLAAYRDRHPPGLSVVAAGAACDQARRRRFSGS
jgi:PIN domain nuclease of toxin-antitoxin system